MPINNSYNEEAIVKAIATALDSFYTNLIGNIDKLNIKKVMKRKNPYLFRAKAMNGAAQIIDAILAAFVSSSEETIFGNVFFEPIATAAAQGQKALAEGVDIMVERDNTIYAIAVKSGTSVFNADSRKKQEQNFMAASWRSRRRSASSRLSATAMGRRKPLPVAFPSFTWNWLVKISGQS